MAHIIAFMNETFHPGFQSFALAGGSVSMRRNPGRSQVLKAVADDKPVVDACADAGVATEEVRMDRVNALRAAIADGSYKVSAADLADKILHAMLEK